MHILCLQGTLWTMHVVVLMLLAAHFQVMIPWQHNTLDSNSSCMVLLIYYLSVMALPHKS